MPLDELVDEALNRTDYRRAVTGSAEGDVFDRLDNLAELACDASVFARDRGGDGDTPEERLRLVDAFLDHWRSMRTPERTDDDDMRVTLSTLHGAKGFEFDTVVIVGFDAEHLPHLINDNDCCRALPHNSCYPTRAISAAGRGTDDAPVRLMAACACAHRRQGASLRSAPAPRG